MPFHSPSIPSLYVKTSGDKERHLEIKVINPFLSERQEGGPWMLISNEKLWKGHEACPLGIAFQVWKEQEGYQEQLT